VQPLADATNLAGVEFCPGIARTSEDGHRASSEESPIPTAILDLAAVTTKEPLQLAPADPVVPDLRLGCVTNYPLVDREYFAVGEIGIFVARRNVTLKAACGSRS
jgi:hypothetical protein